jgi:hypothetical protein
MDRTPGVHWIGGWVGSRAGLDVMKRRKSLVLCRLPNQGHPTHILITIRTEFSQLKWHV